MSEENKDTPIEDKPKGKRGRPKGSKNKVTQERIRISELSKKVVDDRAHRRTYNQKGQPVIGGLDRHKYLLNKLMDYNFDIIPELLERYNISKRIFNPIAEKILNGDDLNHGDISRLDKFGKEAKEILLTLLSYCYPRLRATEIQAGAMDRVVFNIMPNKNKIEDDDDTTGKRENKVINIVKGVK